MTRLDGAEEKAAGGDQAAAGPVGADGGPRVVAAAGTGFGAGRLSDSHHKAQRSADVVGHGGVEQKLARAHECAGGVRASPDATLASDITTIWKMHSKLTFRKFYI